MSSQNEEEKSILPHHVQQPLCTTRLAYRQGRKLTAVKVYTINDESVHLLIFGVPSLNLRRETKSLFCKFGKVLQFNITEHTSEAFTETYHAVYERLQSARIAKKMLDGKNFYGGLLHVCYAPEMESLEEVRSKLMLRRREVYNRLKSKEVNEQKIAEVEEMRSNNEKDRVVENCEINEVKDNINNDTMKMNMAEVNVISFGNKRKKKVKEKKTTDMGVVAEKCAIINEVKYNDITVKMNMAEANTSFSNKRQKKVKDVIEEKKIKDIDVVDCTNVQNETVTNIYEVLNEKVEVRKMPQKCLNKIVFFNK